MAKTELTLNSTHGTVLHLWICRRELQSSAGSIIFTAAERVCASIRKCRHAVVGGDALVRADQNLKILAGSGTCRDSALAVVVALTQAECESVVGQAWTPATGTCTAANPDMVDAASKAICEDGTTHTWTPAGTRTEWTRWRQNPQPTRQRSI